MDMAHDHHMGHNHMDHMDHSQHNLDHAAMGHNMDMVKAGCHDDPAADASNGTMSGHMMHHMMSMAFHFGFNETILFDFWKTSSVYGVIGSMIGIVIMAALYEGLKYYREHLFWSSYNALQYRSVQMPVDKSASSMDSRVVHVVGEVIHKQPPSMLSKMHALQTGLHVVQMIISYLLMLIFMTYNVYLCAAVVVGSAIGYFLFGWKKSVVVDVTEHCH
ncbi:high affinity copper uptake protein 1 isoform X1 [Nilaparvata lugens]|uniref:high affinity copper uptake protein 1 isoform X1 n=2 Tax=Nilaparvata lugens TaxID=108931 RepID=UPI00193DDC72|nr:high affinity copper uptake protein 1 isoform X1 [Nilaparvata lugens]